MIQQLLKDNSIIENKIRFIKEVVNETIIVHKMKKIDLEVMLKDKEYMLVDDTYDYLLRIPVYNLTIDKVEDLEDEYRRKCEALEKLVATEIKDMWKEELDNLDTTLSSVMEASIDKKITKGKGGRKIKTT